DRLDASLLLAPMVKFVAGDDPRWRSTLAAIEARLTHGPLVDRYDQGEVDDGFEGDEGSFVMCSFWFVEALARAGEPERAAELFDRLLTYSGPLGLFSEEIGVDGQLLGNYPQAFSHLALVSAAVALSERLDGG
ncbi:MAG: glycoside hydrolase family 15 protein, partial [Acidimicrobiales bacterium]